MRQRSIAAVVLALALCACGAEPDPVIDPSCARADRACPMAPPFAGAPCEGELSCPYSTVDGDGTFTCEESRWAGGIMCLGCGPVLAESCGSPFGGSAPAPVELGVVGGAWSALGDGERVEIEWGAQGFAMVGYRVRVGGDAPPQCVRVVSRVRLDGGEPVQVSRTVALRCGESLKILDILPDLPCSSRDYVVDVEVDVEGVGSSAARLTITGGGCPRARG